MSWLRNSCSVRARTSSILWLISSLSLRGSWRFVSARIRAMTSRARLPSATMLSSAARASAIAGGSAASQRAPAPALATIAPKGWPTSCAIEVVSSPSVVSRATRASSVRASLQRTVFRPQRFLSELALADVPRERQVEKLAALFERAGADLDGEHGAVLAPMARLERNDFPCAGALASRPMDGSSRPTSNSRGCIPMSSSRLQPMLSQACRLTSTTRSCSSSRKKASVARSTNVRKRASLARSSSSACRRSVTS